MSIEDNIQVVKAFFAAVGNGDKEGLLVLVADGIEWIISGEDWPLAGAHRGQRDLLHPSKLNSVAILVVLCDCRRSSLRSSCFTAPC